MSLKEEELNMLNKLSQVTDKIVKESNIPFQEIKFRSMEIDTRRIDKTNTIEISKDYVDNFFKCLTLIIDELINHYGDNEKINFLKVVFGILSEAKIITSKIKDKLIFLGFTEKVVGCRNEYEINSKDLKLHFFDYDIAIGLAARSIGYGCGRQYRILGYNFKELSK